MEETLAKLPQWLPTYWVVVTLGRAVFTVGVLYLLTRGTEHRNARLAACGLLLAWAVLAIIVGRAGLYELDTTIMFPPPIMIGLLTPVLIGYLLFRRWGAFRELILSIPHHHLVLLQVLRISGGVFLYVYWLDAVPGLFGLFAGFGDLTTGLLGLPIAYFLMTGKPWARKVALWWNGIALVELVLLMPLGMVTSPAMPQLTSFDAPNYITSFWPSVLAPAFHVPLGMLLHIYGFVQLSRNPNKAKAKPLNLAWLLMAISAAIYGLYALLFYGAVPLVTGKEVAFHIHPIIRSSFEDRYLPLYVHIAFSVFALVAGPLQFVPAIRERWPKVHRMTGRVYIIGGVFVGGVGAFYLAMKSFAGLSAQLGFGLQSSLLMFTGAMAFVRIRRGDVAHHREWMIRNYSLIFAAVTLRIYLRAAINLGYELPDIHGLNAWICWVPNLLVAEWLIRRSRHGHRLRRALPSVRLQIREQEGLAKVGLGGE